MPPPPHPINLIPLPIAALFCKQGSQLCSGRPQRIAGIIPPRIGSSINWRSHRNTEEAGPCQVYQSASSAYLPLGS